MDLEYGMLVDVDDKFWIQGFLWMVGLYVFDIVCWWFVIWFMLMKWCGYVGVFFFFVLKFVIWFVVCVMLCFK